MAYPVKSGIEFLINTTSPANQFHPTLTALQDGRFVATWIDESETGVDLSGQAIRAQILNGNGGPSGKEFLVNSAIANAQAFPDITTLADGRFVITWSDNSGSVDDTSDSAIRAQLFAMDGTREGDEFLVNTITANDQFTPSISALADGGFVIAWSDNSLSSDDTSSSAVRAQVFAADATRQGDEFLANSAINNAQLGAAVTGLSDGRFVITWSDGSTGFGDSSGTAIRAQIFAADGTMEGGEFLVNTVNGKRQYDPDITALVNGGFVITWMDESESGLDQSGRAIRAQIYGADGERSGVEFLVNTITQDWQHDPAVTALDDGRFVIVWTDASGVVGDTSGMAVRAQMFNQDGTRAGEEFLANTITSNWQFDASVSALVDGRFVISWTDHSAIGGDISGSAVRGQIFDPREAPVVFAGTGMNDDFVGTIFDDDLSGAKGNDTLFGADGDDLVHGNKGHDGVHGGKGDDHLYGDGGKDTLTGGTGHDHLYGGKKGDVLKGGYDKDRLFGGTGNDSLWGDFGNDRLVGQKGKDDLHGGPGKDILIGEAGNDLLKGDDGNDTLKGGAGDDRLFGGAGKDILNGGDGENILKGGKGNDVFVVDTAGDSIVEHKKGGVDAVRSSTFDLRLADYSNIENLDLRGTANLDLFGQHGANKLTGNKGNNFIRGYDGEDILKGGPGDDELTGNRGNDLITGGAGRDEMTGGLGEDIFIFADPAHSGKTVGSRDLIHDFDASENDLIDLSGIDANTAEGDQAFTFIGTAGFTSVQGQVRATTAGGDKTIIRADVDGDGIKDIEIELTGLHNLTASDFLL